MSEMKKVRLGDIAEVTMGQSPKSEYYNSEKQGIPFLQGNRTFGRRYPVFDTYTTLTTKMAKAGDVIMSVRAPVGDLNFTPVDMCLGRGVCSIRMKNGNQDYLFYLLRYNMPLLLNRENGSVFGSVNRNDIIGLELNIVDDPEEQKKIARYLSMIDDKIEKNDKINNNLSDILQTVYQQSFNLSEQRDSLSGILSDICIYSKDKIPVTSLNLSNYYSTENMLPEKAGAVDASSLPTITQTTKCKVGDVLISNIRPYFKKIVYCQSECGCSTDVLCFSPKHPELSAYVFSTLYADGFFNFMVAGAKGTKMPRGDKQQIMSYPVHIPTDAELESFNQLAKPILSQIESNRLENSNLMALRNGLLPKLMSGELDATDIPF